jgi:hypothetical protein
VRLPTWLTGQPRDLGYHHITAPRRTTYAIPLTYDECAVLADSLALVDKLARAQRPHDTNRGVLWARNLANDVARTVGTARARGYQAYVPIESTGLTQIDNALDMLMGLAPMAPCSDTFEQLVRRMHTLAGMSRAFGWALDTSVSEPAWLGSEPTREHLGEGGAELSFHP